MKKQSSKLLFLLKSHILIPNIKLHLAKRLGKKEKLADPSFIFYSRCGYFPNLKDPKTFNEKITWLKNNYRNPLWQRCANKLEMKSFLAEIGLGEYAVKTLGGPYLSSKEINLDALPNKFVLKTNHDCGTVFVCDKSKTDFPEVFRKLDDSISRKYYQNNGEWVYEKIQPNIFAEEVVEDESGADLKDYKICCCDGEAKFLYVISNRNIDERINLKYIDYSDIGSLHVCLKTRS